MKALVIALIVAVAGFATWRIIAGHVDRTKPDAVAKAFVAQLKANNLNKASAFWVPDSAEAWKTSETEKFSGMGSGSLERMFEDMPDGSVPFTQAPRNPKAPANEQTWTTGGTSLDLRQIDGKWYVCKSGL